ncbi:shikimate 5-dehydrogenase [Bacteroidia bacterium]|nr:shikimate 5-dehydrogenase [Bacteroidia bacterium]
MKLYGLIGFPLGHSFSKRYFTEKFEKEGIDAQYLNFEIEDITAIKDIVKQHPDLAGFNVTIPHKQTIIPYLSTISEEVKEIGAVNCVKIDRTASTAGTDTTNVTSIGYSLKGYNTDCYGFAASLAHFIPKHIKRALVLGSGGGSKAVQYVLRKRGINYFVVSRNPQPTTNVKGAQEISYADAAQYVPTYTLLINTTPLGMHPKTEYCPELPYEQLTSSHYLFDLIYNPEKTLFLQKGEAQGAHTCNGMEMLIGQAEKGWEVWNP